MTNAKLYYIVTEPGNNPTTVGLLERAAAERQIETVPIYAGAQDITRLPELSDGDMLYKISTDAKSTSIYSLLASRHRVATVHRDNNPLEASHDNVWHATMTHAAYGLPIVKTVFDFTRNRTLLDSYVESLGGYPVVIKASGGSHGIGVVRVDSKESLYSVADLLKGADKTIMRQYVPHEISARLIVLGDEVVASVAYTKVTGDFRTNVGKELRVYAKDFGEAINAIAVKATQVLGAELGGVDILIDSEGNPHLAEVNTPCFFPRAQNITGVDIAGKLVDHLIRKSGVIHGR